MPDDSFPRTNDNSGVQLVSVSSVVSRFVGRRIAVLGASGFLGARMVSVLAEHGAEVTALARGTATTVPPGVRLIKGDMRRRDDVAAAIADAEVVFALAGRSGAGESFGDPIEDLDVNARGLLNIIQVVIEHGSRAKVVFPSSRLVYGRQTKVPVGESSPLNPTSPYALHKMLCEEYLALYHERFGLRYGIGRLTNPFGPTEIASWRGYNVITNMIRRALRDEPLTVFGDGRQLRDYIFVDDAIEALAMLALDEKEARAINIGSGIGMSIVEAAETIVRTTGRGSLEHVPWPDDAKAVETGDFVADTSMLVAMGWRPMTSFEDGVKQTIVSLSKLVS